MSDNIDLSPSIVYAFRELAWKNPNVNTSSWQVNTQTAYYFTRLVQYQYAGYGLLMWATQTPDSTLPGNGPITDLYQSYQSLMIERYSLSILRFWCLVDVYVFHPQNTGTDNTVQQLCCNILHRSGKPTTTRLPSF